MTNAGPGPLDPDMEALEARVRQKLSMGIALSEDEREFFARMPADKVTYIGRE